MLRVVILFLALTMIAPCFAIRAAAGSQESTVYVCSMHPEVQSSTPGNCPKCNMKLVVQAPPKKEASPAEAYTCAMHPEIRVTAPGKCPKCGMTLVGVNPGVIEEFDLRVQATPAAVKPNEPVKFRFVVSDPRTGRQVNQFAIMHDKLFHLFVVSQDLTQFQHIHPALESDGGFTIETVLPKPGHYKLYCDIYPVEGAPQVLQRDIATAGYRSDLFANVPHLTPDSVLSKTADGMKMDLKLDPAEPIAGKPLTLKYRLTDEKSSAPVTNLQPYLGAWGHTLILSEDQTEYVHSHPAETVPEDVDRGKLKGGPDVTFEALLPRPGIYRVWTQFQRGDILTTVSFTIRAAQLH